MSQHYNSLHISRLTILSSDHRAFRARRHGFRVRLGLRARRQALVAAVPADSGRRSAQHDLVLCRRPAVLPRDQRAGVPVGADAGGPDHGRALPALRSAVRVCRRPSQGGRSAVALCARRVQRGDGRGRQQGRADREPDAENGDRLLGETLSVPAPVEHSRPGLLSYVACDVLSCLVLKRWGDSDVHS